MIRSNRPAAKAARRMALAATLALAAIVPATGHAATPAGLLAQFSAEAGAPASAERGAQFFSQNHGREWSCSSCHGTPPTGEGRHASTGRAIRPLAPAFDAERFTDEAKVAKWFRRNCRDVVGRECTAGEKADLLAWLVSIRA